MTLGDLLVLYGAAGVLSAGAVYRAAPQRNKGAAVSAALCVPLWPLWLPVVLGAKSVKPLPPSTQNTTWAALWEAHEAVVGTSLEPLLPRAAALRMLQEVERATERHGELVALLQHGDYSLAQATQRIAKLERAGATPRALAPARLHLENVRRLDALRARDEQTLSELFELATTLRTQLVLARYAGSAPVDAGDIVSEVWARVEVLGTTLEVPASPIPDPSHAIAQARPVSG